MSNSRPKGRDGRRPTPLDDFGAATDEALISVVTSELAGVAEGPRLLSRTGLWVTFVAQEPRGGEKILLNVRSRTSVVAAERVLAAAAADRGGPHGAILPVRGFGLTERLLWVSLPELGGRSLGPWFSDERVPSPTSALEFLRHVAAPLIAMHGEGRVHGALTPSSFHRDSRGVVRVCCPGVDLQLLRGDLTTGTDSEAALLAAPEVQAGQEPRAAADQYGLAAILVRLSAGLVVTRGEEIPPEVPRRWAPTLRRALDCDPHGRWRSIREVVEALDPGSFASASSSRRVGTRGTYQPSAFRRRRRSGRRLDAPARGTPPAEDLHLLLPPADTDAEEEGDSPEHRPVGKRSTGRRLAGALTLLLILGVAGLVYVGEPASLASGLFAAALDDWYAWAPIGERLERTPTQTEVVDEDTSLGAPPEPAGGLAAPVDRPPERVEVAGSDAPRAASSPRPAPAVAPSSPPPTELTEPLAPGRLSLQSYPWGAVYIDGVFMGNTPLLDVRVPAGDHQIRIERPPYDPFSLIVTVEPGQMLRLTGIVLTGGGR